MGQRAVPLRIQLLGAVRAARDAELDAGPPQRRAVLAVLALAGGHPVTRDELTAALWPEGCPPRATNIIQTHVKHLRQVFEPDRPSRSASALLPALGAAYALRVGPAEVDALRFRALVTQARGARGTGDRTRFWLAAGEAVRMWRPPAPDLPLLLGHPRLLTLVAEWHAVLSWYVDAALERGCVDEVLPVLEEQARDCPLDERVQARLLRAYRAVGRRDAAFAAFERVRQDLAGELGVDPCPELAAAHLALLHDDAPPPPARPAPVVASRPAHPRSLPHRLEPHRPEPHRSERAGPGRRPASVRLRGLRTWDVLVRMLPRAPAALLDLGEDAGRFAGPLAGAGYSVHVAGARPEPPGPAGGFDGVLMLDPRRHGAERAARVRAWRRAARRLRPDGVVVAATVNRVAATLDGLLRGGVEDDPPGAAHGPRVPSWRGCVDRGPAAGHRHRPDELAGELAEAGLRLDRVVALEGPAWAVHGLDRILADGPRTARLLDALRELEGEPTLLGVSDELLVLARPDGRAGAW
ncbi:BTAD domain-containing putative transcriptional regulator [Pseudonocardia humida]|uniref:Winged helix-turn-helix domain-containing protein n=1 Tax=Pseudonocardia humida TaxID=2800819 RepID=A0ABT0ZSL0_9PSEU|nr:BTAD domain-containing putative transcriptional regulator [Pseudonocardia humida]MCO1653684.1 winged helix-turn-helix domain-containing protein [Pseudonocardia humida]